MDGSLCEGAAKVAVLLMNYFVIQKKTYTNRKLPMI